MSTTLRNAGFRRRRRRGATTAAGAGSEKAGRRGASSGKLSLESLLAAKSFIESVGSIDKAEEAIGVLKRLQ